MSAFACHIAHKHGQVSTHVVEKTDYKGLGLAFDMIVISVLTCIHVSI